MSEDTGSAPRRTIWPFVTVPVLLAASLTGALSWFITNRPPREDTWPVLALVAAGISLFLALVLYMPVWGQWIRLRRRGWAIGGLLLTFTAALAAGLGPHAWRAAIMPSHSVFEAYVAIQKQQDDAIREHLDAFAAAIKPIRTADPGKAEVLGADPDLSRTARAFAEGPAVIARYRALVRREIAVSRERMARVPTTASHRKAILEQHDAFNTRLLTLYEAHFDELGITIAEMDKAVALLRRHRGDWSAPRNRLTFHDRTLMTRYRAHVNRTNQAVSRMNAISKQLDALQRDRDFPLK